MKGRGEKDAADAKAYRLLQAEKLLELFKGSHKGRPVQTYARAGRMAGLT